MPPVAICNGVFNLTLDNTGLKNLLAVQLDNGSYDPQNNFLWFKIRRLQPGTCNSDSLFRSQLTFCCADIGDSVAVILRVYNTIVDTGGVSPQFGQGNYSDCITKIIVREVTKPLIATLPPVSISCETYLSTTLPSAYPVTSDNCCIDTVFYTDQYVTFDQACKRGIVRRRFTAKDCSGNTATSTQTITVVNEQHYYVQFPEDHVITGCTDLSDENLGRPIVFENNCENMNVTFLDSVQFNNQSGAGPCMFIKRTWRIFNWCQYSNTLPLIFIPNPTPAQYFLDPDNFVAPLVGPNGIASLLLVSPGDTGATNYSMFWNQNDNGYFYQQSIYIYDTEKPKGRVSSSASICDLSGNDPNLWQGSNWYNNINNTNDLFEAGALISLKAIDNCSQNILNASYLLYLDLNSDGIEETLINSNNVPPAGSVFYNNLSPGQAEQRQFDRRITGIENKYIFALEKSLVNDSVLLKVRFNTMANPNIYSTPQLPYGYHRIVWTVADQCGNTQSFQHSFSISSDCEPPVISCIPEIPLSISAIGIGSAELNVNSVIFNVSDNVTPTPNIQRAIEKEPFGTTFPLNQAGQPRQSIIFGCNDLGFRSIRVWARDAFGNASFCSSLVALNDQDQVCSNYNPSVSGSAENMTGAPVTLDFELYKMPDSTYIGSSSNIAYNYYFFNDLEQLSNYFIRPVLDSSNLLNGVNTYDLILISRHILNLEPLDEPYKLIAADANKSGTITTFDIVTLRKAILGTITAFPNNTSWRFVPKNFQFTILNNPFAAPFPERLNLSSVFTQIKNADFYAIKTGDVDYGASNIFLTAASDRSTKIGMEVIIGQKEPKSGKTPVYCTITEPLAGFQLALRWHNPMLFEPVLVDADHFQWNENVLSLNDESPLTEPGKQYLIGYLLSEEPVQLPEVVHTKTLYSEAYSASGLPLSIQMTDQVLDRPINSLQINPNPSTDQAELSVHLHQTTEVVWRVTGLTGQVLAQGTSGIVSGAYRVSISTLHWPDGVYLVFVDTGEAVFTQKMVVANH